MIKNQDACRIIEKHRGDAFVVPTMGAGNPRFGWPTVTHNESLDIPVGGAMGKASSFALGLALAQPNKKVFILDGDGSLVMNLGTLTTIAEKAPANFYHFVFENGCYAVTGGQPIPAEGKLNFKEMALSAGYASAYEFDNLEDFASNIAQVLQKKGPVMVSLRVQPEIENIPVQFRERPRRGTSVAISEVRKLLQKSG
jgi:sulfopyruvate decarboxylase subunit beta